MDRDRRAAGWLSRVARTTMTEWGGSVMPSLGRGAKLGRLMTCLWVFCQGGRMAWPSLRLCHRLLCVPLLLAGASRARAAEAPHAPRVLVVNSFGSRAPPFTTHSTAF